MRPQHPKTDKNQARLLADLRATGWPHIALDVSALPVRKAGGDLFIGGWSHRHGGFRWLLVEVKRPGLPLTASERAVQDRVRKLGGDAYLVAYSAEDVLRWFGVLRDAGAEQPLPCALRELAEAWEREAMARVPPDYASRGLEYKFLAMDNEAAGLARAAEELRELIGGE